MHATVQYHTSKEKRVPIDLFYAALAPFFRRISTASLILITHQPRKARPRW